MSSTTRWLATGKIDGAASIARSVVRVLRQTCDRVGRADTRGKPWIWRLRNLQLPAGEPQPADIAEDT
jgi:hypothetical protein